jgi:hypothetical protein
MKNELDYGDKRITQKDKKTKLACWIGMLLVSEYGPAPIDGQKRMDEISREESEG